MKLYKPRKLLAALFLLWLILVACNAGDALDNDPDSEVISINYVGFDSAIVGLALEYPEDWLISREDSGQLILVSKEELVESDNLENAGVVPAIVGPSENFQGDLIPALQEIVLQDQEIDVVEEASETTINGQRAATMTVSGNVEGVVFVRQTTLIVNEAQAAVLLTIYDQANEDTFAPIMDRIVNSIRLK